MNIWQGCMTFWDQRRPFRSSSERWVRFKVDSVAKLNPIQVSQAVETLQGAGTQEVKVVERLCTSTVCRMVNTALS